MTTANTLEANIEIIDQVTLRVGYARAQVDAILSGIERASKAERDAVRDVMMTATGGARDTFEQLLYACQRQLDEASNILHGEPIGTVP